MFKALRFFVCVVGLIGSASVSFSDTGHDGAVRKEGGRKIETRSIAVTTHTATLIIDVSIYRPDETCINNSAYTLWIGSQAAGVTLSNIGFPIVSSATFKTDSFTGSMYGLADSPAAGDINVRCADQLVR